jgi:hypothetical protein
MAKIVRLTEQDLVRLTKKILKEGFRMDLNPTDLIAKLNTLPNKTAQVVVEGDDLVFIINGQKIGLDCSAPSQGSQSTGVNEQEFNPKKEYLSKGYKDVTDGFMKDTYALQIPDGTYKCDGMGYSFKIVTNEGKDTGYVVVISSGIRGMITGPVTVSENGVKVSFGQWNKFFESLLYNEKLNQVKLVK